MKAEPARDLYQKEIDAMLRHQEQKQGPDNFLLAATAHVSHPPHSCRNGDLSFADHL